MKRILSLRALCLTMICLFAEKTYARETVFVHPDRQVYVSGETIRFSARLMDLNSPSDQVKSAVLYLQIADSDGRELLEVRSDIAENGISYGCIVLPDTLATGLYFLTAYTNCMRNYDRGWLHSSPLILVDRRDEDTGKLTSMYGVERPGGQDISITDAGNEELIADLKITTGRVTFGKREKVKVTLSLRGLEDVSSPADISISVSELAPFPFLMNGNRDIRSFIASENNTQPHPKKTEMKAGIKPCIYLREDAGYLLSGTVTDKSSGRVLQNACVLLSVPDSVANLKYCLTDTAGRFYFLLDKCYNNRELILQTRYDTVCHGNAEIRTDGRSFAKSKTLPVRLSVDDQLRIFLNNCLTVNLINNSYSKNLNSDTDPEGAACAKSGYDFFGKPDNTIYPSDFIDLPDFSEIIENLIPYVRFKSDKNGDYTVQLPGNETHTYLSDENALVMLNNVPLYEYDILKDLNSGQISKIQIFQRLMMYGDLQISGIISVTSGTDFLPLLIREGKVIQVWNNVLKRDRGLILNDYGISGTSDTKIPDFRQTLYWNPDARIEGGSLEFEFWTSDLKAAYEIKAMGLTDDGRPVYATKVITVQ
jgi:hypothetical protein